MPGVTVELHPPRDEQVFEDLCVDLFRSILDTAQLYGRRGHQQNGIDLYGRLGDEHVAIQCKKREGKLTTADVAADVLSVRKHETPFDRLIFATTAPRNTEVPDYLRTLKESFTVDVWFWDDLVREICARDDVFRRWDSVLGAAPPLVDVGHLPSTILEKLIGRTAELAELDAAWSSPEVRAISVVAVGGAGKTALVHHWMQGFEEKGWKAKGASAAFAWSFYSQGGGEDRQASGDLFIEAALTHFGDRDPTAGSPYERGVRLAGLVRRRRALLILDGLEPLQEPPASAEAGKVKDPAVAALVRSLAADNPGLLVVTSREPVLDLASREGRGARKLDLDELSEEAGADLLHRLGARGPDNELRAVSKDVHGHAFTLTLLGTYLRDAHGGDVRAWKDISLLEAADLVGNPKASRLMAAYADRFGEGPEQQILGVVGLFDRPAAASLVAALREKPAIPAVTDELVDLPAARWNVALSRLRRARLLVEGGARGDLDAHPLVRECFGRRLRERHPDGWKAAHGRLFDHLKGTTEYRPDTLERLRPLYRAVVHGCLAGRQQEACVDVYYDRISRGGEAFVVSKLGTFGDDLGAVAYFFEPPWSRVSPALAEIDRAWLLNEAAFRLRALGRLTEAVEPMRAGLQMAVEAKSWKQAAIGAGNLSELELTLGDVAAAVRDAEGSVNFADRSGDEFERMSDRTTHADALHAAGRRDEALELFREAEAMLAERQPEYPQLYSLAGVRYCDLLLTGAERAAAGGRRASAPGECTEVEHRAAGAQHAWRGIFTNTASMLDGALDHLTLGRARLYRAILDGTAVDDAATEIEQAVDGLRLAGTMHHIPRGLLTRAWLRSVQGDLDGAHADLDEAQEIAERGPMPLHLADVHLYRARLFHDRAALAEARRLVEKHGYWRRREELADAEEAAATWEEGAR